MKFTSTVDIGQPVAEVYRYLVLHPQNMKHWVQGFKAYRPKTGGKRKKGSVAIQVFDDNGHKTEVREEVLEAEANQRFRCMLTHKNMLSEQDYHFLDQGGNRTMLRVETEVKLRPAIFNWFGFLAKRPMRKQQTADLKRLKSILEEA